MEFEDLKFKDGAFYKMSEIPINMDGHICSGCVLKYDLKNNHFKKIYRPLKGDCDLENEFCPVNLTRNCLVEIPELKRLILYPEKEE